MKLLKWIMEWVRAIIGALFIDGGHSKDRT